MPELPDITVYVEALEKRILGETLDAARIQSPFLLRTFDPPLEVGRGQDGPRDAAAGKAHRGGARRGIVARRAPDDRRPAALEAARRQARAARRTGGLRFSERHACCSPRPARSAARRSICCAAKMPCATRTRAASRSIGGDARAVSGRPRRENHTLKRALTDPHIVQRHRQRLFRRDPPSRPAVSAALTQKLAADEVERLYIATRDVLERMDRPAPCRSRRRLSRESHRVPPRHGRPRPVRPAVPGLRRPRAADPLRRQRDELLRRAVRPAGESSPTARYRGF